MSLLASFFCLFILVVGAKAADRKKPRPHHSHRFLVAQRVQHGLAHTPLRGLGFVFEAEGHRRNLSPFFLVGASGTESSLGAASCSGNPHNYWGLGSCDRAWKVPHFRSAREAIRYYADFIKHYWPHAQTVYELYGYCPPCGARGWGEKTYAWMRHLFGPVSKRLEYPR